MTIDDHDLWMIRGLHGLVQLLQARGDATPMSPTNQMSFEEALEKLKNLGFHGGKPNEEMPRNPKTVQRWLVHGYVGLNEMLGNFLQAEGTLEKEALSNLKTQRNTLDTLIQRVNNEMPI